MRRPLLASTTAFALLVGSGGAIAAQEASPEPSPTAAVATLEPGTTDVPSAAPHMATGTDEDATALLDQLIDDWNAGDREAVADLFMPGATFVGPGVGELIGEDAGSYVASFVPTLPTFRRTGDALDNGDGSYSFTVEWENSSQTAYAVLVISTDGENLLAMTERSDPAH